LGLSGIGGVQGESGFPTLALRDCRAAAGASGDLPRMCAGCERFWRNGKHAAPHFGSVGAELCGMRSVSRAHEGFRTGARAKSPIQSRRRLNPQLPAGRDPAAARRVRGRGGVVSSSQPCGRDPEPGISLIRPAQGASRPCYLGDLPRARRDGRSDRTVTPTAGRGGCPARGRGRGASAGSDRRARPGSQRTSTLRT
jgi:hypothetical protein